MSTQPKAFITPEQYLEIEHTAENRSEYYKGEMFAMSGGTRDHTRIILNILTSLESKAGDRGCEFFSSDMRIQVSETGLYTYPDVSGLCGTPEYLGGRKDTLVNPAFLFEVLSPSTEAYDRGRKFRHYRTIRSLQEYVLVASDRKAVDICRKQGDAKWSIEAAVASIELKSLGITLTLDEIYRRVELPEE